MRVDWVGPVPDRGMLVANHLGYLDVLALASVVPATFVAKSEVRSGPLIGRLVQMAGTLWVDRTRRSAAARTMAEMDRLLKQGGLVVLFPEGTSSAGHSVLPFKSALLESACAAGQWWAAHIRYEVTDGSVEQEVAYWGEATFGLHLLNLLKKREIRARVRCERVTLNSTDRKQVARQLHAAVERLALETAVARPSAAGAASRPAQLELLPATGKAAIG